MRAAFVKDWNIIRTVNGTIGIVRNDIADIRGMVCVQLKDKSAIVIQNKEEVEIVKEMYQIVYDALDEIVAQSKG